MQDLKRAFQNAGFKEQERAITYAIKRSEQRNAWERGEYVESLFNHVFFNLPVAYGLYPGRPLRILLGMMLAMSLPYFYALTRRGPAGIWAVWSSERVNKNEGGEDPVRLSIESPLPGARVLNTRWQKWRRWPRGLLVAFYFSLLSTFHVGWRDFNMGNWIGRIQPREYVLRATRWVRVVSGVQSVVSVYLFALWALAYFGRPFE